MVAVVVVVVAVVAVVVVVVIVDDLVRAVVQLLLGSDIVGDGAVGLVLGESSSGFSLPVFDFFVFGG